jgi:tyrosinase
MGIKLLACIFGLFATSISLAQGVRNCHPDQARLRREWSSLTDNEKNHYINGIKCLQALPSKYPPGIVPASTSYYSDFTSVHINMTLSIHINGVFLGWHRHFLSLMEDALHEECAYPNSLGLPYWDWTKYITLETSSLFNGGQHSLGGNGDFSTNNPAKLSPESTLQAGARGFGGGCVTTGPFANMTVNFGPFPFSLIFTGLPSNWSTPTPHCMTRDLNSQALSTFCNKSSVEALLTVPSIGEFHDLLNPAKLGTDRGIHGGGHFAVGGTMFDLFSSPDDPVFFLHHSQIDRLWAIWQSMDATTRRYQYNGTSSIFNGGDTPQVSNDTVLQFGILGSPKELWQVQNPMSGSNCYRYL